MIYKIGRLFNWLYARMGGYFWLPCPICGRNFGGHEGADECLMTDWHNGQVVCKTCGDEAVRRNIEYCKLHPFAPYELGALSVIPDFRTLD